MIITPIPFEKLHLSDLNVRKTGRDAEIAAMADDLASRGLKQNLNVIPMDDRPGHYAVIAGGRRFLGMQLLVQRKAMKKTDKIPCMIGEAEDAIEDSLAENVSTIAMNPADEVLAFSAIVAKYADDGISDPAERIKRCAHRFGRTVHYVEQKLRLANLHDDILSALRDSRISIEAAKAYAAFDDQAMQLKVFEAEEKKTYEPHRPASIRDAMRSRTYPLTDRRVLYVGLDPYLAAGGRIDRDLFMGSEADQVLLDPSIIDRLAADKASAEAKDLVNQTGLADVIIAKRASQGYVETPPTPKGFKMAFAGPDLAKLPAAERKTTIAIASIAADGAGLVFEQRRFVADVAPVTSAAARNVQEQRIVEERIRIIRERAARLAVPRVGGTPLEGRAFWPTDFYVEPFVAVGDGKFHVALLIEVTEEELAAHFAEAEAAYDVEQATASDAVSATDADGDDGIEPPLQALS